MRFKIENCIQGTDEWMSIRKKYISASNFSKLITKSKKPSTQWKRAVDKVIASRLEIDDEIEDFQSQAMIRGCSLEHEAFKFLNISLGLEFEKVGFLIALDENGNELFYGGSPDAINLEMQIGAEIKSPLAATHIGYLLDGGMPEEYYHQVQGLMYVTGFKEWIFMSYHPQLPPLILKIQRDDSYINALDKIMEKCVERFNEYTNKYLIGEYDKK